MRIMKILHLCRGKSHGEKEKACHRYSSLSPFSHPYHLLLKITYFPKPNTEFFTWVLTLGETISCFFQSIYTTYRTKVPITMQT